MSHDSRIYLSAPDVGDAERLAVTHAIDSGWVAPLGPEVDAFEAEVAARVGAGHGVALSSGTAALHLGLITLGVQPGDWVITSTFTFVGTVNPIAYIGARPFFIDSDPHTGNMNPTLLRSALEELRTAGERVGAIVPVDLLGRTADYAAIRALADEFGVPVLSDAAESLGALNLETGLRAGAFGNAAVLSFNGNKIMTTSGGGMLLTDDADLAERARFLSTQARDPAEHYEHSVMGFNYRMSNVLAALGRAQLARLDEMIGRRRALRERYRDLFASVAGVEVFQAGAGQDDPDFDRHDNCWLTAIVVNPEVAGWAAHDLATTLSAHNIESRPLWKPMHLQPLYADALASKHARAMVDGTSERLFEGGLALPSGSVLGAADIARITDVITEFLSANGR